MDNKINNEKSENDEISDSQTRDSKSSNNESKTNKHVYSEEIEHYKREMKVQAINQRLRALEEKLYMLHSITNLIIERESYMEKAKTSIINVMLAGLALLICPLPIFILGMITKKIS